MLLPFTERRKIPSRSTPLVMKSLREVVAVFAGRFEGAAGSCAAALAAKTSAAPAASTWMTKPNRPLVLV